MNRGFAEGRVLVAMLALSLGLASLPGCDPSCDAGNLCSRVISKVSSCMSAIQSAVCAGHSSCHATVRADAQSQCQGNICSASNANDGVSQMESMTCSELAQVLAPYVTVQNALTEYEAPAPDTLEELLFEAGRLVVQRP